MPTLQKLGAAIKHADVPAPRSISSSSARARSTAAASASTCTPASFGRRESQTSASSPSRHGEAPYYSDAERAALALTEAGTRLADRPDPVPDDVWQEAARHYDDPQLAALVLSIAGINAWNRVNAITRQLSGEWVGQFVSEQSAEQPLRS
jgi:alkylhydroperoxidase family enzyme